MASQKIERSKHLERAGRLHVCSADVHLLGRLCSDPFQAGLGRNYLAERARHSHLLKLHCDGHYFPAHTQTVLLSPVLAGEPQVETSQEGRASKGGLECDQACQARKRSDTQEY